MKFLNRRGSVTLTVAASAMMLLGVVSLAVDVGYMYSAYNRLQRSTNAAALAAAQDVGRGGSPAATAAAYGAQSGAKNALTGITVTTTTQLICLSALACTSNQSPATSANAVLVTQTAKIPLFFARVFGYDSATIQTKALALAAGRASKLNVEFIVDTTQSMGSSDSTCSGGSGSSGSGGRGGWGGWSSGTTRLDCALKGFQTMLSELQPCQASNSCSTTDPIDKAALLHFPPTASMPTSGACSNLSPVPYSNSPLSYFLVPLESNYTDLNNCIGTIQAKGGVGTFYADAIKAAQNDLIANTRSGAQNVMILLSDGEANARSSNVPSGEASNQCQQAVQAAQTATRNGTLVYSLSYGSSHGGCTTDVGTYRDACTAMHDIASDPTRFYADDANGCQSEDHPSITSLQQMFEDIAYSLAKPRLLPLACLPGSSSPGDCSLLKDL